MVDARPARHRDLGSDAAPSTSPGGHADAAATRRGRLTFLDALRGIAALTVVVQHIGEYQWVGLLGFSSHWFRPGEFGVLVFFLCSGFIIPASLERRNDLVEFWINRVFRLWPLYLLVLGAILLSFDLSARIAPPTGYRVVEDSLLNLTMLQVFSTRPLVIGASWTLGYELVFYLLVSLLFLTGQHRRSVAAATLLFVTSLGLGGATTLFLLQRRPEHWWALPLAGLIALVVLSMRVRGTAPRVAALATGTVVVLALSNRPHQPYFSLLLLAFMFTGTVLYRWTRGQLPGRTAAAVYGLGLVMTVLTHRAWHVGYTEPLSGQTPRWWTEAGTFAAAYLVFGGALLLRRRRWPRLLTYLGTISYSVYLVHTLVLIVFPPVPGGPWVAFGAMLGTTLVASVVTYHLVEKPAIDLGRRIAGAARQRREERARHRAPGVEQEGRAEVSTALSAGQLH